MHNLGGVFTETIRKWNGFLPYSTLFGVVIHCYSVTCDRVGPGGFWRQQLQPASWGQSQIVDASHLFVFCYNTTMDDQMVDDYMQLKAETQGIPLEALKGYGDYIKSNNAEQSDEQLGNWNARQVYIALGNLLVACADLKIEACPMEGFEPAKYNEILGLDAQGLSAFVLATVGYRSEEDATQSAKKVRKPLDQLFEVR